MKPFIKYQDGSVEQSYLCHMFYIASLGFNIVPGHISISGVPCDYESTPDGIRLVRKDGEAMVIPFREAMALVSKPVMPDNITEPPDSEEP